MKKKILAFAVAAMSIFSIPTMAQTPDCNGEGACPNNGERCPQGHKFNQLKHRPRQIACPFEQLGLSDSQKEQIKQLNDNRNKQRKERDKIIRQQRDSISKVEQREYLDQLKKIMGNDKYVEFLENSYINQMKKMPKKYYKMQEGGPNGWPKRMLEYKKSDKRLPRNGQVKLPAPIEE